MMPPSAPPLASPPAETKLWQLGIGLIVFGCMSSSIGLLLMKRSTDVEDTLPLYKRWRWLLGFLFLVVNATIIDLIAYGITPLSLIAPFAGLTMVFSLMLARSGLFGVHESLTERQIVGTAFVILGVTTVSVFGPHSSDEPTMAEIFDDFSNPTFIMFASLTLSMVALYLMLLFWSRLESCRPSPASRFRTVLSAYCAAVCGAESQLFLKVVSVGLREVTTGGDSSAARQPAFILSLIGLALTAPLQLYLLNSTLASSPVSYAVPLYQALLIMLTAGAGGIFFKEFSDITIANGVLFTLGATVAMAGLAVLSLKVVEVKSRASSQTEFIAFEDDMGLRKPAILSDEIGRAHV